MIDMNLNAIRRVTDDDKDDNKKINVGIELKVPDVKDKTRLALELAIILDVSGSMRNDLKKAKDAIESIINRITTNDLLHLVEFSDAANIVFEKECCSNKKGMKDLLDQICCGGDPSYSGRGAC